MECRDYPALSDWDIAAHELWLDAQHDHARLSLDSAKRLVATIRHLQGQNRQLRQQTDAAFALLAVDCSPAPDPTPQPGDFGTDPAADWPTDFPEDV